MPRSPTLTLALVLALAGCARVGGDPRGAAPEPLEPEVPLSESRYRGIASLSGQRMRLSLALTLGRDGSGSGRLELPEVPLLAEGKARLRGDRLELELQYGEPCPGTIRIEASVAGEGRRAEGSLTAHDCTGKAEGTVTLEREAPPPGAGRAR